MNYETDYMLIFRLRLRELLDERSGAKKSLLNGVELLPLQFPGGSAELMSLTFRELSALLRLST